MKVSAVLFLGVFFIASTANSSSSSSSSKPTCKNLVGKWVNELTPQSTLQITSVGAGGKLSGTYTSPSGTSGSAAPMIGWTNKASGEPSNINVTVVSFSVNWGIYGSVTSWSGYCSVKNEVPTISTIWNLVEAKSTYEWNHILTNSDTFTPQ